MSLAERRRLRLFTLCVLYVAQGIPWGFTATTLPAYLVEHGVDASLLGAALSFTTLPYTFKWVWGPIIDLVQIPRLGRRRPWIVFAQAMMALTIFTMIALDLSTQIKLLAWTILIHTVFNALQDVAVDALAVDLLDETERGRANGLMYGSKYFGGFIGGFCMANLIAWSGLDTALVVQTSILLAIMLVPLLVSERGGPAPPRQAPRVIARALAQAFSLRSTIVTALLTMVLMFASGLMTVTALQLFIDELKWDARDYTSITGGYALALAGVLAGTAGFFVDKFGRRRLAAIASCALAAGWIAWVLLEPYWSYRPLVYALGLYEAGCQATLSVAVFALCMDLSWPRIAGTQFSAYMALINFSTTLGYLFAGTANEWWNVRAVYLVAGGIQLAITLLLIPIDPTETRRKLAGAEGGPVNRAGLGALLAVLAILVAFTIYQTLRVLG